MRNPYWSTLDHAAPRRSRGRRLWAACLGECALAALLATGCAKARAETVPDGPPLATPAPPPRVLAPVEQVLAEVPPPPEIPPESRPAAPTPRPAQRRPPTATEVKPPETPPASPQPPPAEATVREPPANPMEERKIADLLARAQRDLNRVDYQKLTADGKQQYEESKRFSELAEGEMKGRNYPMAATLADKAATVAAGLLGR